MEERRKKKSGFVREAGENMPKTQHGAGSPHVSMTALTFSATAAAQRAEREEAGVKLPSPTATASEGPYDRGQLDGNASDMLAQIKTLMQKNRQLQRQARELRSAHSRVERLEQHVAEMQQELRDSEQTGECDSAALEQEHNELNKLVAEAQSSASAALQEMAAVELRVMRAIRGECEDPDDDHDNGKAEDWSGRRAMQNECVASVSSYSEGGAYALSQDTDTDGARERRTDTESTGESDQLKSVSPGVAEGMHWDAEVLHKRAGRGRGPGLNGLRVWQRQQERKRNNQRPRTLRAQAERQRKQPELPQDEGRCEADSHGGTVEPSSVPGGEGGGKGGTGPQGLFESASELYSGPASLSGRDGLGTDGEIGSEELGRALGRLLRSRFSPAEQDATGSSTPEDEGRGESREQAEVEGGEDGQCWVYDRSGLETRCGPEGNVLELLEVELRIVWPLGAESNDSVRTSLCKEGEDGQELTVLLRLLLLASLHFDADRGGGDATYAEVEVISFGTSSVHQSAARQGTSPCAQGVLVGVWVDGEEAVRQVLQRLDAESVMRALATHKRGILADAQVQVDSVRVVEDESVPWT